ncbi:hypothetical protein K431DRAFT_97422 [Polychaeton citri CBS 116435]|uniref:Uncharacterized protein n=1 Tax=Polychaeton citri CBS 116435 TaxID=1314669 RepID=A0A9P4Q5D2_9PEZI|nr:hypothetical protein K431DRAFT_97422 [Polychaeton citri CBS 116435]
MVVEYIKGYIADTAAGYLKTGITAAGTMAGNTVGGVGGLIENGGRSVGDSVTGGIQGFGNYINSYGTGVTTSLAADGPTRSGAVKKTAVKPSASPAALPGKTAPKGLPAPSAKGVGAPKPPAQLGKKAVGAVSSAKAPGVGAPGGVKPPGSVKSIAGGPAKPPVGTQGQKNKLPDGRVKVSAASRPKSLPGQAPANVGKAAAPARGRPAPSTVGSVTGSAQKNLSAGKVKPSLQSLPKPAIKA